MSRTASSAARSASVFAALGDETRLWLLSRLCERGPLSITQLTEGAEVTRQAVTKHLRRMAAAGVLRSSRQGRESFWELQPSSLDQAGRYLQAISGQWDAALSRLKKFVEE